MGLNGGDDITEESIVGEFLLGSNHSNGRDNITGDILVISIGTYHDMETVSQNLDACDWITIRHSDVFVSYVQVYNK